MLKTGQAEMVVVGQPVQLGTGRAFDVTIKFPMGAQGIAYVGDANVTEDTGAILSYNSELFLKGYVKLEDVYVVFDSDTNGSLTSRQRVFWYTMNYRGV